MSSARRTRICAPLTLLCGAAGVVLLTGTAALAVPPPMAELGFLPGDSVIAPAVNTQQEQSVARGGDQCLVAWSDYRGRSAGSQSIQSDGDIFGIRLDLSGQPVDEAPFLIAGGMGLQQRPLVAWNGQNWLVVYTSQDPVGGYFDHQMRAVRVSPAGTVLDATPILFPPTQFTPNTIGLQVAGQGGQWLITRCIYHDDGYGTYLAGQRIDGNGQLVDQTPIVLIDWIYGQTTLLAANGEYLAGGPDWNTSWNGKARRIGLNAQPIGNAFSVPSLSIATNGNEYYVVWVADYVNIVGSRMTNTGTLLTPAGTMIVPNFAQYTHSALAHDGTNWWLEWGVSDILHTVRINAAGTVLDPGGGVLLPITIGGNVNTAYSVQLVPRNGGVMAFWYDLRVALGYDTNVFTLPVSAANVPGVERCVSTGSKNQRNPELSRGPGDTSAIVFVSEAADDDAVLLHLLDANGTATTTEPIEVFRGPSVGRAGVAWNGSVFMVAWDQGTSGQNSTQLKARRLNADGSFIDAAPISVMPGFNAAVGALGEDFLVAGARFAPNPQSIFLVANRIDGPTGAVLDGANGLNLAGWYVNSMPRVRSDGTQWWVAAHSMWSHDSSQGDAILVKVPPAGTPTAAFNPTPFSGASGDLDIAWSGNKYLLVWRMNSLSNANNYIAGRIMNADGSFPPGYFTIAEAYGRQLRPTVQRDGTSFIVAWEDQRNQASFFDARTDIYGVRVSETGALLDPVGFPICASTDGEAGTALLSRPDGVSLVACARFTTESPLDTYRIGVTRIGAPAMMRGDINCDGAVDFFDIDPLVLALSGAAAYAAEFPNCDWLSADCDMDGDVDFFDIDPFVALLGR